MSRVRLLLTTSELSGGGAEREFTTLLHGLDRSRFDMRVALWRDNPLAPPPEDVPVTVLQKEKAWHVFRTIRRLAECVDEFRPDVIFSMLQYPNLVTGSALRRASHDPRWTCRFLLSPRRDLRGLKQAWARRVLPDAAVVLSCADGLTRELAAFLGTPRPEVRTIRNPIDLAEIRSRSRADDIRLPDHDGPVLVHSGRLVPQKNQRLLLEAFSRAQSGDARLWILGTGPLEQDLRTFAGRLGIADRVDWLGFMENPYPIYRAADCLVLSSDWEGLPNVILEAMACDTPVIATRCEHGPDELIEDGVTGCLVPTGDPDAMAGAIDRVLADAALRDRLSSAASSHIDGAFANGQALNAYADLFENLARKP